jgi:hypothetical protein
MRAFMAPVVDQAYIPSRDLASTEASVSERVTSKYSDIVSLPPVFLKWITEFESMLIPTQHAAHPVSVQTVVENITGSRKQRAIKALWRPIKWTGRVNAFLKREPATKKAGRIITTYTPQHSVEYARYIGVLEEWLKKPHVKWYAFSKKPHQIAVRVAEICRGVDKVVLTDLSSMDGRISLAVRDMELRLLLRLFRPDFHKEVTNLHQSTYSRRAYLPQRQFESEVAYDTGFARGSGSRDTSALNTILSALMAYCSYRRADLAPLAAWEALGVFGGDDGLTPSLDFETFARIAAAFGQVATGRTESRGGRVEFLSRVYSPAVWDGVPDSTCDVIRCLGKFHLTTLQFPDVRVAYAKAKALTLTDSQTPVVGILVKRICEVCETAGINAEVIPRMPLDSWTDRVVQRWGTAPEVHYPNAGNEFTEADVVQLVTTNEFAAWLREYPITPVQIKEWLWKFPTLADKRVPIRDVALDGVVQTAPVDDAPAGRACEAPDGVTGGGVDGEPSPAGGPGDAEVDPETGTLGVVRAVSVDAETQTLIPDRMQSGVDKQSAPSKQPKRQLGGNGTREKETGKRRRRKRTAPPARTATGTSTSPATTTQGSQTLPSVRTTDHVVRQSVDGQGH